MRRQAEDCGVPFALAATARSEASSKGGRHFLEALAWHERQPDPFQSGRTLLCYGELLRREKRRSEARSRLDAALTDFEGIGAASWPSAPGSSSRQRRTARRRAPDTRAELTPQDLQVAALVTEGLTNREIATRLFLSPRRSRRTSGTHFRSSGFAPYRARGCFLRARTGTPSLHASSGFRPIRRLHGRPIVGLPAKKEVEHRESAVPCSRVGVALAIAAQPSAGVSSGPSEMTWTDSGSRSGGPFTFTAAPPLCPSGTGNDVGGTSGSRWCTHVGRERDVRVRGHGSGLFHFNAAGTGRYATLRGTGSCSLIDNGDGTYTRSCHALADFDDTAPSARIAKIDGLGARRVSRVGVTFTTSDNVAGNAVTYRLSLSAAGRALDHMAGTTPEGRWSLAST